MKTTVNGRTYLIESMHDDSTGVPWDEYDGHGIVSEWTSRDKRAGELILCENRRSKRYYDFAGTCERARKEGWELGEGSKRQRAVNAVLQDFERLRAWCDGQWEYVILTVTLLNSEGKKTGLCDHLGSVESDYTKDAIEQLISELEHGIAERTKNSLAYLGLSS